MQGDTTVRTKICALCGKEFQTRRANKIYCDDTHYKTCKVCGKLFVIKTKDSPATCSKSCAAKWKVLQRKPTTRICALCGKPFVTTQSTQTICKDKHFKVCPICGHSFEVNSDNYFQLTCSRTCAQVHREQTNIEKYGVPNPSQSSKIKDKKRETVQARYGVDNPFQLRDKIAQTCLEKYGTTSPLSSSQVRDKISKTNLQKYGVENVFQSEEIKEKSRQTCLEKYGVEYASQSEEIQSRRAETMIQRYGVANPMQSEVLRQKAEQTCLDRYGARHYLQTEEGISKVKHTMLERYGAENIMQSEEGRQRYYAACMLKYGTPWAIRSAEVQDKIRKTNQSRRGVDYPFQSDDIQGEVRERFLAIYGVDNPLKLAEVRDHIRDTVQQRYGVDEILAAKEIRRKIAITNLTKYGVENVFQSKEIKEKSKQTCLEKYGEDHYTKTAEYRSKYKDTMMSRYGTSTPLKVPEIQQASIDTCMEKYNVPYPCMTPQCRNAYHTISKVNQCFASVLDSLDIEYEYEFPLGRFSFDFHIIGTNILIEIDPTITHNSYMSIFDKNSNGYDSNYHLRKSDFAREYGYRCIHVWDWNSWDGIVKLLLTSKILYARNCEIRIVNTRTAVSFTSCNHLAGSCKGQTVNYGLYFDQELVQVMTFGKPRYNRHYEYELLRLCTVQGTRVIGGASKLFHQFVRDYSPESIISYCDKSKFTGDVYTKIGMTLKETTVPNKIWSKSTKYITNNLLLQRGYDQLFGTSYGKGTSNEQLMLENGWLPVYDCGQYVFEYFKP